MRPLPYDGNRKPQPIAGPWPPGFKSVGGQTTPLHIHQIAEQLAAAPGPKPAPAVGDPPIGRHSPTVPPGPQLPLVQPDDANMLLFMDYLNCRLKRDPRLAPIRFS